MGFLEDASFEEERRLGRHIFTPSDIVVALSKCRNSKSGAIAVQRLLTLLTSDWAHEMPTALARVAEMDGLDSAHAALQTTVASKARGITEHALNLLYLISLAWPNLSSFTEPMGEVMGELLPPPPMLSEVVANKGTNGSTAGASLAELLLQTIPHYLSTKSWVELNQVVAITASVSVQGGPTVRARWRSLGAMKAHLEVARAALSMGMAGDASPHGSLITSLLYFFMAHFADGGKYEEEIGTIPLRELLVLASSKLPLPNFTSSLYLYAFSNLVHRRSSWTNAAEVLPANTVEAMLDNLARSAGGVRYHSTLHCLAFFRNYVYGSAAAGAQLLAVKDGVEILMRATVEFAHDEEVLKAGLGLVRNLTAGRNWSAQARMVACGYLDLLAFARRHVVCHVASLPSVIPLLGSLVNFSQTRLGLASLSSLGGLVLELAIVSLRVQGGGGLLEPKGRGALCTTTTGEKKPTGGRVQPPPSARDLLTHHKLALTVIHAFHDLLLVEDEEEIGDREGGGGGGGLFLREYVRLVRPILIAHQFNRHLLWRTHLTVASAIDTISARGGAGPRLEALREFEVELRDKRSSTNVLI